MLVIFGQQPILTQYSRKEVQVLVTELCLAARDPTDCSSPGSSVHGILQVRILERVAIHFFNGTSQPKDQTWVSRTAGRLYPLSHQGRATTC